MPPIANISPAAFRQYLLGPKSAHTAKRYSDYIVKFLQVLKESDYTEFTQLPPGYLSQYASMLAQSGAMASTIRVQTFAAKKYLEWVHAQGIPVTPQSRPELPQNHPKARDLLPPDMVSRYFQQADIDLHEPIRTAVMLLPCCGLRAHEMIALKLSDIKKAEVVLKGKTRKTLFLRLAGKGGRERNVPLMEEGVELLTGYLAGWRKKQPGVWLFPSLVDDVKGRNHISDRHLRKSLQTIREPLGIDFTPHTMRRTYITTLWRRGMDLATLAKIAGHANVQTTVDHYIVMEPGDTIQALHNVGGALT
jgi:integrase/recombinase XerD